MLTLHKTPTGHVVEVEGGGSFPLPAVDVLKSNAIRSAIEFSSEDSEAVRILRDCELDYEIVPGKDSIEELIGIIVTTSPEFAAALNSPQNPLLPEVMGALWDACPDLGSEAHRRSRGDSLTPSPSPAVPINGPIESFTGPILGVPSFRRDLQLIIVPATKADRWPDPQKGGRWNCCWFAIHLRDDSLAFTQSCPVEPKPTSFFARRRPRRSLIKAWGGGAKVLRLLAILLVLSLSHDLGAFSESSWHPVAIAAEAFGEATDVEEDHEHQNPVTPVLLAIVMILFLAKVGGDLFERMGLPAVLGELLVGIILGNFAFLTGSHIVDQFFMQPQLPEHVTPAVAEQIEHATPEDVFYQPAAIIRILAGIGVVLLLFEVGLESTVREMMSVGASSLLVAVLGVAAPMILGWGVGWLLIREAGAEVHAFIGATLCATSVGITARVLKDLGRSKQRESQIILGAAVIDDVLGLVILTVVSGVIMSGAFQFTTMLLVILKAALFLVAAVLLGAILFTRPLFKAATYLYGHGLLVSVALVICFGFAWLATLVNLEPIVGAFAAGLILERAHYRELGERENEHDLAEALAPISTLLVPIFFVQMGTQVRLESFQSSSVWGLAIGITLAAIIGKQVCALGVLEKGMNRLAVGLGMIPRGEVGLIFAGVGKSLKVDGKSVIDDNTFSAIIVMVMITTMVTPPLLKWALTREDPKPISAEPPPPPVP